MDKANKIVGENGRNKYIVAVSAGIGTIILGAIGSAVWDFFKPAFVWLVYKTVSISTFGFSSVIDSIYASIALGPSSLASHLFLTMTLGVLLGFAGGTATVLLRRGRNSGQSAVRIRKILLFGLLILALFSVVGIMQDMYVLSVSENVAHIRIVIAPFITEKERLLFQSRLAQAKNRDEFVSVVSEMQEIARANKLYLPKLYFI